MHRYGSCEDLFENMHRKHAGHRGCCNLLFVHEIRACYDEMS